MALFFLTLGLANFITWMRSNRMGIIVHILRYLIRAETKEEYHQRLATAISRWPEDFRDYFMCRVHPEIDRYALWTMRAWNFPTTENSIITSNQCEHINRLQAEQQEWQEMPLDTAFFIGRDIMNAKVAEMARGRMGFGNMDLLPEFKSRDDMQIGQELLRRIGGTPPYEQIVSKYKETRDVTRHAGVGQRVVNREEVELDGQLIDIAEADFEMNNEEPETRVDTQPSTATAHYSSPPPAETSRTVVRAPVMEMTDIHVGPDTALEIPDLVLLDTIETMDEANGVEGPLELSESADANVDHMEDHDSENTLERTPANPLSLVPDYELTPSPVSSPTRRRKSHELENQDSSPNVSSSNPEVLDSSPPFLILSPSPLRVPDSLAPSANVSFMGSTLALPESPRLAFPESLSSAFPESPTLAHSESPSPALPTSSTPALPERSTPLPVLDIASPALHSSAVLSTPAPTPLAHLLPGRLAPTPNTATPQDDIQYIPTMDTYILPGRLFPITVKLKENLCSQCGSRRANNWCPHLRSAAIKAGVKVVDSPLYLKSLTQLRKNQRADRSKSGRKQPRKFDLVPMRDLYNSEETEQIQLQLDSSYDLLPRSNVDTVIDSVISQVSSLPSTNNEYNCQSNTEDVGAQPIHEEADELVGEEDDKLWCICHQPSSGEMIGCDDKKCKVEWYHFSCLNIKRAPKGKWLCPMCRSTSTKRKLEFEDENEKAKKPKTLKVKCDDCGKLLAKSYLKIHLKKYCK